MRSTGVRFAGLVVLLLAADARAERGHQAYERMIDQQARHYEEWANKPCTPRGRLLVNMRARVGATTMWRARLYTTGHWNIRVFDITQTGCDRSKRRTVRFRRF